jgi:hypothetical protein
MSQYENWTVVFSAGTDYEADLVRDRLDDAGVPAIVMTKRDHSFNVNVGDLADVSVLVPHEHVGEATEVLSQRITDEELERAAMSADPEAPDAHSPDNEARLDSGHNRVDFSKPDQDEPDQDESEQA